MGHLSIRTSRIQTDGVPLEVLDAAARRALPDGVSYRPIRASRGLTRAAMHRNTYVPSVHVPRLHHFA